MVPSIADLINELLTNGVTMMLCDITRDSETEIAQIILRPLVNAIPEAPGRCFAAYGDQLLPLDGVQTFSEAVMRSGMTDAQKIQWLYLTCQEYEEKYARGLVQGLMSVEQEEAQR